jgi:hypothetical protein
MVNALNTARCIGQAAEQPLPALSGVAAAGDLSAPAPQLIPVLRPAHPGGQEDEIGVVRMHDDRIGVVGVVRHRIPLPGRTAILARHHADQAVGDDDAIGIGRVHQDAMDVAFARIGIDGKLGEALAEIVRDQQRADLDADHEAVAVDDDVLDVADPWRRWKAPLRHARGASQRRQLAPAHAGVVAQVEMRRQRPDQHHVAPRKLAGACRPEIVVGEPVVAPGPGQPAVAAAGDPDAVGRREQGAVVERGHRAHGAALQGPMNDDPPLRGSLQEHDAVDSAHEHIVGARIGTLDVGSAVRQQDHRCLLIAAISGGRRCAMGGKPVITAGKPCLCVRISTTAAG